MELDLLFKANDNDAISAVIMRYRSSRTYAAAPWSDVDTQDLLSHAMRYHPAVAENSPGIPALTTMQLRESPFCSLMVAQTPAARSPCGFPRFELSVTGMRRG
jgi:hypothetical protein